jgi:hypothetical protein
LRVPDDDLHVVNLRLVLVAGAVTAASLAACGGGHAFTPGQAQAAAACQGSGSAAAVNAANAAHVNPSYVTLAADETALAASESTQVSDLSDGSSDASDASALAAGIDLGSAARQKVIADCVALGLPVTPMH